MAAEETAFEEVIVTGSRVRRDEFTSAAPIRVLDVDAARKIGITSIADMLQRTTMATGQQIGASINTGAGASNAAEAPPDGGVGSANIGLRGLGSARTLVMINGKRLGSSGARGAPSQPDLNMIPFNMVERVEVITEGASSVYGADAVAGVVNLILKDSFEGFEVTGEVSGTEHGGGFNKQFSFITGLKSDKAKFMISGEFQERSRISVGQRRDCMQEIFRKESGEIISTCSSGFFDNAALDLTGDNLSPSGDAWIWYTPGQSDIPDGNGGFIPNWSSAYNLAIPTDPLVDITSGNQRNRYRFDPTYHDQLERLNADLVQPITRFSVVSLGSYSPDWFGGDEEIYYEAYFLNRHQKSTAASEQIFPTVAGKIRQEDANGNIIVDGSGAPILVNNPLNPFGHDITPVITIDDHNQVRNVELNHFRFVGGFRGDFTTDALQDKNWSYDISVSYDRGVGYQSQNILNETNLILATETLRLDSDGNLICGVPVAHDIGFISPQACVPVNFLAPSVFISTDTSSGTLATDEERKFLFGSRTNRTVVEQALVSAFVTGDLMELPAGPVGVAMGLEYRKDSINSTVDYLGGNGVIAAESPLAEGATVGSRSVKDIYGEIVVPLLSGHEMADSLVAEGALRYTDETNFGSKLTTRGRLSYRPVEWMTISGSYGTSFRAANLRESFIADQFGGIGSGSDPCTVPAEASSGGAYVPAGENRPQVVLDNCILQGADPYSLGLSGGTTIPVVVGGNAQDLKPETSRSWVGKIQISPPISDDFAFDLSVGFFDIKIKDTIRSIDGATILSRCFNDAPGLTSPFCSRVARDSGRPDILNFASEINASYLNIGEVRSQGIDVNTRINADFDDVFGQPMAVTWATNVTFQTKLEEKIFIDDEADDLLGDFGNPKTSISSTLSFNFDNIQVNLQSRYFTGTESSLAAKQQNNDACDSPSNPSTTYAGQPRLTEVCTAGAAFYQDMSVTYDAETFTVSAGITNLFDKTPPLVNLGAGSNRANRVTSSGYDQFGRSFFLNVTTRF
ncbi:MAG: TonB-dependent receptor [Emcibacter sp.]|nr:TonB-dependent receptor [Emcibacter sp.]